MYAEGLQAYASGDHARARNLFDQACKTGDRSAYLRLRAIPNTAEGERQETKSTPEIIAKPQSIPSPALPSRPPDREAPVNYCALDQIAGTYRSSHGPLVCKPVENGLDCCYGSRCEKTAKLAFDQSGQNMVGTWRYPNGTNGLVTFPVSSQCALQSGRWGNAGQSP
jgi:hypothetical protein